MGWPLPVDTDNAADQIVAPSPSDQAALNMSAANWRMLID
ncbi:MAG: hypothetical protein KatS3mg110_2733 [Pirellulaceae bacterium]|nr:MAG: hypothetical protein KatS3mg110_2733 [Pirellulaceae bacterium]